MKTKEDPEAGGIARHILSLAELIVRSPAEDVPRLSGEIKYWWDVAKMLQLDGQVDKILQDVADKEMRAALRKLGIEP